MMVYISQLTWLLFFSIQFITIHSVTCTNNAPEIQNCETKCQIHPRCKSNNREAAIDVVTNARKAPIKCGLENTFKKKECGPHINDKNIIPLEFAAAVPCQNPDDLVHIDLCYEEHDAEDDFHPRPVASRTIVQKQKISRFRLKRSLIGGRNSHHVSKSEIWKATATKFRRYYILDEQPNTINDHSKAIITAVQASDWFPVLLNVRHKTYNEAIIEYNHRGGPGSPRDEALPGWIADENIVLMDAFVAHVDTQFRATHPGKFIHFKHHRGKQNQIFNQLNPPLLMTQDGFLQDAERDPEPGYVRNPSNSFSDIMAHETPGGPVVIDIDRGSISETPGGSVSETPGGPGVSGGPEGLPVGRKVAHQSYFNKLPGQFTEEKYDYDRSSAPIFDFKFYLWSILLIGMCICCMCVALMCFLGGIWIGKNFVDNKSDVISIECSEV